MLKAVFIKDYKIMSRKLITSYFSKPKGMKRKHDELEGNENNDSSNNIPDESSKDLEIIKALCVDKPALYPNIGLTWFKALEKEFLEDYFDKLGEFLCVERQKYTIYPPKEEVYTWTTTTNINEVKVVILGQDPYHGYRQAHGLAFSVRKGIEIPKSLRNIYKELANDIPGFKIPLHGNLSGWANQGVLLLNTCLTVRENNANSHRNKGWEQLTTAVIKWINSNLSHVVFMLWGNSAKETKEMIDKDKHMILTAAHPSPLSASRGFFGCCHFSKCNEYLKKHNKKPIDWSSLC